MKNKIELMESVNDELSIPKENSSLTVYRQNAKKDLNQSKFFDWNKFKSKYSKLWSSADENGFLFAKVIIFHLALFLILIAFFIYMGVLFAWYFYAPLLSLITLFVLYKSFIFMRSSQIES